MTYIDDFRTDFSAGHLDVQMLSREDTKMFQRGARKVLNCAPRIEGGLDRRPGTDRIVSTSRTAGSRWEAFSFNSDQVYLVALEDTAWYIYDIAGTLLTSGTGAPWTTSELADLDAAQEGDVMVIAHENFKTQILTRTGASSFTLAALDYEENTEANNYAQPYYRFTDGNIYMTPARGYIEIVTATDPGAWTIGETITGGTSGHTAVVRAQRDLGSTRILICNGGSVPADNSVLRFQDGENITGGTSGRVAAISLRKHAYRLTASSASFDTTNDLDAIWRLNYTIEDSALDALDPTWYECMLRVFDSTTVAYARERRALPTWGTIKGSTSSHALLTRRRYETMPWWTATPADTDTIPTDIWEEPTFSVKRGYARSACFHNQRLAFAGHTTLRAFYWISRPGAYFNFDTMEGADNGSIQDAVGTGVGHQIQHIRSNINLTIITDRGAFAIPESPVRPLTPANHGSSLQTAHGGARVEPVVFDDALVYVQVNGATVLELRHTGETNSPKFLAANPLNLTATSLVSDIVKMVATDATPTRPEQLLYCLTSAGTLAVFHGNSKEQIAAWFPWTVDGTVKDIVAINNEVYLHVQRSINSVLTMQLEKINWDRTVDGAIAATSGTPTNTFTGFGAYNGEPLAVVSGDGRWYYGELTPSGGTITLPGDDTDTDIVAGYDYSREVDTMPAVVRLPNGNTRGGKKRIVDAKVLVNNAAHVKVNGRSLTLHNAADLANPLDLQQTWFRAGQLGWSRDASVQLRWDAPLSCQVLGIAWRVAA